MSETEPRPLHAVAAPAADIEPGKAVYADVTAPGQQRPVLPYWLRSREDLRIASRRAAGREWHRARYHGLRFPWYAAQFVFWGATGSVWMGLLWLRWWLSPIPATAQVEAVEEGWQSWLSLHRMHKQTTKTRAIISAVVLVLGLSLTRLLWDDVRWVVLVAYAVLFGIAASVVLIEDGVIAGISRFAPDGWPVLRRPGTSLLPGFIDGHTHVLLHSYNGADLARQMIEENLGHRAASAVQAMSVSVRHGFTTIRDLGTEGAGYVDVGLRDAAREGIVAGPRMLVAGPAIRSAGRYPIPGERYSMTFPVGMDSCTGVTACRETVRTQVSYGIDCLKIYVNERFEPPTGVQEYPDGPLVWTDEEVRALVDEAHRQGIPVAAHSLTLSGTKLAVAAGVDSIEHGFAISPGLAADMAARGTALVPTLLVTREHVSHMSEPVRAAHNRSFVNCLEAGVRIVLGTDVGGFEWTSVPQAAEFTLMTRLGMPAADALQAGTLRAAELLGLAGTAGVIERGAAADIVAVTGDPLRDIECLQQVELVIQAGQVTWDGAHLTWDGSGPAS